MWPPALTASFSPAAGATIERQMLKRTWCGLMIALGWLALALGFLGVFIPLLPTTPISVTGKRSG
jgi:hypothetical protein